MTEPKATHREHQLDVAMLPCRSTLLSALRVCLAAAGDDRDTAEIAGMTGLAFLLNVDEAVSPAGVAAYPWAQELPKMLSRLGYTADLLSSDDEDPMFSRTQARAITQAVEAAWQERPSVLWGVHLPEFGLVRGFRAATRELLISGVLDGRGGAPALAYDRVGRGDVPVLLLATPRLLQPPDPIAATTAALRAAVRHARDLGPRLGGYACGLAGWSRWRAALESGHIDPSGHAYTMQVVTEWRAAAPPFLRRAAKRLGGDAAEHLSAAAAHYQKASERLIRASGDAPFPLPDDFALTSTLRTDALAALEAVAEAEARGVDAIERALFAAHRQHASAGVSVRELGPGEASALFPYIRDMPLDGLEPFAAAERERVSDQLGDGLRALHARGSDGEVVGELLFAELSRAGAPIALEPDDQRRYLYVYSPWVARERRGAGLGTRLIDALIAIARDESVDGIFAEATNQEIYLHVDAFTALGFEVLQRADEDDSILVYRAVRGDAPAARIATPEPQGSGPLRVVVAQWRPCPLLARTRHNIVTGAERARERGARIDLLQRREPPNEIVVGGRRFPLTYIPADAAEVALLGAANAWTEQQG